MSQSNLTKASAFMLGALFLLAHLYLPGAPLLAKSQKSMAISAIEQNPEVLDAAIKQKNDVLSLVVVVSYRTSKSRAKNLAEAFLRMVKTLGPDTNPGKDVGRGVYDYHLGVYFPNEKNLVRGFKASSNYWITW